MTPLKKTFTIKKILKYITNLHRTKNLLAVTSGLWEWKEMNLKKDKLSSLRIDSLPVFTKGVQKGGRTREIKG